MANETPRTSVQTTGHVWDGDLQEYNNPLPAWWIYGFYITVFLFLLIFIYYFNSIPFSILPIRRFELSRN